MATAVKRAPGGYRARSVPTEPAALSQFLEQELANIERALLGPFSTWHLAPLAVEPERPRDGLLAHADGTNWNPGSGAGPYVYFASAWHYLGGGGGGGSATAYAITITPPWANGGGVLYHSQTVAAAAVGPTSKLLVSLATNEADDNDAEELGQALFSAAYESAGVARVCASFPAPVSGAIDLTLMVA